MKKTVLTFMVTAMLAEATTAQVVSQMIRRPMVKSVPAQAAVQAPTQTNTNLGTSVGIISQEKTSSMITLLNTVSKKVGKTTTVYITKRTPDYKPRPTGSNVVSASDEEVQQDNRFVCRNEVRKFTAENMTQDIMTPEATALIKLGAVYGLQNIQSGNYKTLSIDRSPINVFLRDASQNTELVSNPTDLALQQALDRVRNIPFSSTPSGLGSFLTSTQVTSRESLDIAAGLSFSGFGFDASNKFNYNSSSSTNKFLLNYTSASYIAEVKPITDGAFFTNAAAYSSITPVYVSKITYGVKLLVFFEENISEDELKNKFEFSGYGVKADLGVEVKNRMANTTFKIYLYGANEALFTVSGYDNMIAKVNELLGKIATNNKRMPIEMGQPISYQLNFMDGDIAVTSAKVEDIPQRICGPNPNMPLDLEVSLDGLQLDGGVFFGWLDAQVVNGAGQDMGAKPFWIKNREDDYYQSTTANAQSPMVVQSFPQIDRDTRNNGFLRLWYRVQNRDRGGTDVRLSYLNTAVVDLAPNPIPARGGWAGNYIDVPLKEIIPLKPGERKEMKYTIQNGGNLVTFTYSAKFKF
jgi:Thiol-activated cytolysin